MMKAKVLERFQEKHPEVAVVSLDVSDANGDSPAKTLDGVDYEKNSKVADDYEVTALPTIIFEVKGAGEVGRLEGAATLKQLEDSYKEQLEYSSRSDLIPWGVK